MKNNTFAFKLSDKQRKKLEAIAQKERRSKGSVICNLIDDYTSREEKECQKAG